MSIANFYHTYCIVIAGTNVSPIIDRQAGAFDNDDVLSVIVDGMDQSKTNLHHFKGWRAPSVNIS